MNIIMSRALPSNHQAHCLPPNILSIMRQQQQQQQGKQNQFHHQHQQKPVQHDRPTSLAGSRASKGRLSSPIDFADSIPFNELKLSSQTLGSGSFGTVYKGQWRSLNVAVKHFKTREEIDSFSVEVKQLSRVKHPNIVRLYGASSPSKTAAYLIMEYAEGGSLYHLLHEYRQQEYHLRHACSWAMQTARGVAYLHGLRPKPIMHRDLKPANLLLFERGKILKICDFGTACAIKTQMTNNTGSASYMAPEVFTTSSYLESGDVFSWSIIFWEILVRQQPYYEQYSHAFQILWKVTKGARPKKIEDCPEIIWNLIKRSWDQDPNKRPTMKQVALQMEIIFSLASDIGGDVETRSLPRSPQGATTPTNIACPLAQRCEQVQSKYRAFVSRFMHAPNTKKPSPSVVVQISERDQSISHSESSISSAHEAYEHDAMIDHNDLSNVVRISTEEENLHHWNHQAHQLEQRSRVSEGSTQSATSSRHFRLPAGRCRALMRHVALLEMRLVELESQSRCDGIYSTSKSLKEFLDLKDSLEEHKILVKSNKAFSQSVITNSNTKLEETYPTPPPTNHSPKRSHENHQIGDCESASEPQIVHSKADSCFNDRKQYDDTGMV